MDTDLTRSDGIVQCRKITAADVLSLSWKLLRVLRGIPELDIHY